MYQGKNKFVARDLSVLLLGLFGMVFGFPILKQL